MDKSQVLIIRSKSAVRPSGAERRHKAGWVLSFRQDDGLHVAQALSSLSLVVIGGLADGPGRGAAPPVKVLQE